MAAAEHQLPRLLRGVGKLPTPELQSHLRLHGRLPDPFGLAPAESIAMTERAGLCGRGGAAFPAAKKMRAVSADRAIIALPESHNRTVESLTGAVSERRDARVRDPKFELAGTTEHWLAGQETALVNALNGGPVKPTFATRPFECGVAGRPTLVQNVETLAHLALIARHGPAWFRALGSDRAPGSTLVTLSGALAAPGVYEIDPGMLLQDLLATAGLRGGLRAVLIGGYFGAWLPAEQLHGLRLDADHLAAYGASLGAGVIVALDESACPVAETTRIADYFASQTAGQCGPCVNGLEAIAATIQALATGTASTDARRDLARWTSELPGRGACHHPDGAVRFISSALRVFAEEFADHARHGECERCSTAAVLPTPLVQAYSLS